MKPSEGYRNIDRSHRRPADGCSTCIDSTPPIWATDAAFRTVNIIETVRADRKRR